MLVKQVMASKVITVREDDNFEVILSLLTKHHISGLPVVNVNGKVVGIISEKDLLFNLFPTQEEFYSDMEYYMSHSRIESEAAKIKKLTAKKIMTKNIVSVGPDDHILRACALLLIHNIRRLPVIHEGELVGIVSTRNIYKNFLKTLV